MVAPLLLALSAGACPALPPYFHEGEFTVAVPEAGWQYFYVSHPKDPAAPLRLWVRSAAPVRLAAEAVPSCPNETTAVFLETRGADEWVPGACAMRTANRVLAIGVHSRAAQAVRVRLPAPRPMRYGTRKAIQILLTFAGTAAAALAFFCFCVLPGPKPKRD